MCTSYSANPVVYRRVYEYDDDDVATGRLPKRIKIIILLLYFAECARVFLLSRPRRPYNIIMYDDCCLYSRDSCTMTFKRHRRIVVVVVAMQQVRARGVNEHAPRQEIIITIIKQQKQIQKTHTHSYIIVGTLDDTVTAVFL